MFFLLSIEARHDDSPGGRRKRLDRRDSSALVRPSVAAAASHPSRLYGQAPLSTNHPVLASEEQCRNAQSVFAGPLIMNHDGHTGIPEYPESAG